MGITPFFSLNQMRQYMQMNLPLERCLITLSPKLFIKLVSSTKGVDTVVSFNKYLH